MVRHGATRQVMHVGRSAVFSCLASSCLVHCLCKTVAFVGSLVLSAGVDGMLMLGGLLTHARHVYQFTIRWIQRVDPIAAELRTVGLKFIVSLLLILSAILQPEWKPRHELVVRASIVNSRWPDCAKAQVHGCIWNLKYMKEVNRYSARVSNFLAQLRWPHPVFKTQLISWLT